MIWKHGLYEQPINQFIRVADSCLETAVLTAYKVVNRVHSAKDSALNPISRGVDFLTIEHRREKDKRWYR
jgi:hypothetical protein